MASNSSQLSKLPPISSPTDEKKRVDTHLKSTEDFESSSRHHPKGLHREQHGLVRLPPIVRLENMNSIATEDLIKGNSSQKRHLNIDQDNIAVSVISLSGEMVKNNRKNTVNVPALRRQGESSVEQNKGRSFSVCSSPKFGVKTHSCNAFKDWASASHPSPKFRNRNNSVLGNNRKNVVGSEKIEDTQLNKTRLSISTAHGSAVERNSNSRRSIYDLSEFLSLPMEKDPENAQPLNKDNPSLLQINQEGKQPRKPSVYDLREFLSLPEQSRRSRTPSVGQVPRHRTLSRAGGFKAKQELKQPFTDNENKIVLRVEGKAFDSHGNTSSEKTKTNTLPPMKPGDRSKVYKTEIPEIVTIPCEDEELEAKNDDQKNDSSHSAQITKGDTTEKENPPLTKKLEARPAQVLDSGKLLKDLLEVLSMLNHAKAPHSKNTLTVTRENNQSTHLGVEAKASNLTDVQELEERRRRLSDISVNWNNSFDSKSRKVRSISDSYPATHQNQKTSSLTSQEFHEEKKDNNEVLGDSPDEKIAVERVSSVYNLVEFLAQNYQGSEGPSQGNADTLVFRLDSDVESLYDISEFLDKVDFSPLRKLSFAPERDVNNNLSVNPKNEPRRSSTYDLKEFLQMSPNDNQIINSGKQPTDNTEQSSARLHLEPRDPQINSDYTKNMAEILKVLKEQKQPSGPRLQPREAKENPASLGDLNNFINSLNRSLPQLQPRDARDKDNNSLKNLETFLSTINEKQNSKVHTIDSDNSIGRKPTALVPGESFSGTRFVAGETLPGENPLQNGSGNELLPSNSELSTQRKSVYDLKEFLSMQQDTTEDKKTSVVAAADSSDKTNNYKDALSLKCQNDTRRTTTEGYGVSEDTSRKESNDNVRTDRLTLEVQQNKLKIGPYDQKRKSSHVLYKLDEFLQLINNVEKPPRKLTASACAEDSSSQDEHTGHGSFHHLSAELLNTKETAIEGLSEFLAVMNSGEEDDSSRSFIQRNDSEKSLYELKDILSLLNNAQHAKQSDIRENGREESQGVEVLRSHLPNTTNTNQPPDKST